MKTHAPTADLTHLDRQRRIRVKEAAAFNGLSEATFRRHFQHLIEKITPRRDVVKLCDAIDLPPAQAKTPNFETGPVSGRPVVHVQLKGGVKTAGALSLDRKGASAAQDPDGN